MHDHTSAATEMLTLFAADGSANGTVTAQRAYVEHLARQLGLGGAQLSALHAVMTWAVFLRPATDPGARERLRTYLDVMGYLPEDRRIVANAERSRDAIDEAVPQLLHEIAHCKFNLETFPDAEDAKAYQEYTGVTRSQLELLKSILRHQLA